MSRTFEQANGRLCLVCSGLDLPSITGPVLPSTLRKREIQTTMIAAKSRAPNCRLCQFIIENFSRKFAREELTNVSLGVKIEFNNDF